MSTQLDTVEEEMDSLQASISDIAEAITNAAVERGSCEAKLLGDPSVKEELLRIAAEHDGKIRPGDVVDAARNAGSALHNAFIWDDAVAAEQHRINQARGLIRSIKLKITRVEPQTGVINVQVVRKFLSRPSQRSAEGGYETLEDILEDSEKRAEYLERIIRELQSYRKRYKGFAELRAVWEELDRLAQERESAKAA